MLVPNMSNDNILQKFTIITALNVCKMKMLADLNVRYIPKYNRTFPTKA